MTRHPYQQCRRCVMDTSDAFITFDENGYCNHCTDYFQNTSHRTYRGEESNKQFLALVHEIKSTSQNAQYDCVLGISGGVDSCYAAYVCKEAGLRVLCVHMDNGWNSDISVKNIRNIVEKLGFDYESFVLDWESFRDLQLSFLKASVPELETPTDIAILGAMHQVAARYGVKYIISGGNFATEGILPKSWHYDAKDLRYIKSIQRKYGKSKRIRIPLFGFLQELYYKYFKRIRIIYLLNLVDYDKEKAMKLLIDQLGWQYYGGKHYESIYTRFVQSYILPNKFNIDYRRATLSTQICNGKISREQALNELSKPIYDSERASADKAYICKKLDISEDDLNKIMSAPPLSHQDYPNNQRFLEFLYKTYRKLKKIS